MTGLPHNTVSKLFYFDNRIKSFYEKHGYTSIPLDGVEVQKMIDKSEQEITQLFHTIWGSTMGYHLLDKFYGLYGNILEFFMSLDLKNRQRFTTINW